MPLLSRPVFTRSLEKVKEKLAFIEKIFRKGLDKIGY
jgi:hypothetical protein